MKKPRRSTRDASERKQAVRQRYLQTPEIVEMLAYFEAVTIVRHICIPVLCDCGLFDPAVPPPGPFSIYIALQGPKELIVRSAGHHSYPAEREEEARSLATQRAWYLA